MHVSYLYCTIKEPVVPVASARPHRGTLYCWPRPTKVKARMDHTQAGLVRIHRLPSRLHSSSVAAYMQMTLGRDRLYCTVHYFA